MRCLLWTFLACFTVSVSAVTNLTGSHGSFESPRFPDPYPDDLDLQWRITVRAGYRIKLRFTVFDVEDSYDEALGGPCVYDYFVVSENGEELYRFCGNSRAYGNPDAPHLNTGYHSKGNVLTVRFVTDYSTEDPKHGFAVHYIEDDIDECARLRQKEQTTLEDWDELIICNHFCVNVPGSYYCDCRAGFELDSNKHTCVAKFCENVRLTDRSGVIASPDYPRPYGKLSRCQWDINVEKGLSIDITFDEPFDIEDHYLEGCVYDKLTVIHKGRSDTYCGTATPHVNTTWELNTRDVQIQFQSDLSVERTGFRLRYNTTKIRCLHVLQAPANGLISSTNPKGYYEFEDVVTFRCNIGFDLIGESSTTCDNEGEWTNVEPTCRIISCGEPTNLTSVRYSQILDRQNKRFEYLERVTVRCGKWYEQTQGYATWKCEHTKKWVPESGNRGGGEVPLCRPICGKRLVVDDAFSTHISGGKSVTKLGGWPWMAFLDRGGGRHGDSYCGGTLVDEKTVVTAAHCIDDIDIYSDMTVWLGLLDRTADPHNFTQSFTVTSAMRHKHADFAKAGTGTSQYFDNDVAVLKLDRAANLSYFVRPICVPDTEQHANGLVVRFHTEKAVATGWGVTENGTLVNILRKVRIKIIDPAECRDNYRRVFRNDIEITNNMICAGFDNHHSSKVVSDTCQADSGGPLMTKRGFRKQATWYLSGITSFGDERVLPDGKSRCGSGETYGVYTDVGKVLDFIKLHTEKPYV